MECFTVLIEETQGRFDVESNYKRLNCSDDFLNFKKFKVVKFGEIAQLKRGPFGGSIKKEIFVDDRPENYQVYEQYNAIKNNPNRARYFISDGDFQRLKSFSVQKNDILMSCSGTIGKLVIIPEKFRKGVINQALLRIRLNENINLKYFLVIFRYIIEKLIEGNEFAYGSAIRNIVSVKELKEIEIPMPSLEIQNKIVSLMDNAYSSKNYKETEARKLIDSINDYILDELGIKLHKSEDKMCFTINFEEVEIGRIDPISFAHPQDTPSSEKFKEKTLGEVSSLTKGQSITKENITSGEYPVIAGGQSSPYSIDKYNYKGNIITVSASGAYSGYVWFHNYPIFASDCTVIKSLDEKDVSTFYLFWVMKAKQKFVYNMQQGAGQPHVYSRDLSKLKIPLPPLSVQNKIADEVKKRMQKAETLQKETKEELEKAKLEVEKIILG
ncbi:MAG: restriction endonuclease subunit S [DPANN group archaeon]|nr:restriction endonuclease subunit S [DPANN group archaeon]